MKKQYGQEIQEQSLPLALRLPGIIQETKVNINTLKRIQKDEPTSIMQSLIQARIDEQQTRLVRMQNLHDAFQHA